MIYKDQTAIKRYHLCLMVSSPSHQEHHLYQVDHQIQDYPEDKQNGRVSEI